MQLEVYILLQIVAILGLVMCFITKTPLISVLTMFSSAVVIAGSWVLRIGTEYVWSPTINAYVAQPTTIETLYLPWINIVIFALALLMFIYDTFMSVNEDGGGLGLK